MEFDWRGAGGGAVLSILIASSVSPYAYAERVACTPIRFGETAASVAARITGNAHNRHASWFQIVNPTTQRAVPKERYDRIWAGWRACVVGESAPAQLSTLESLRANVARLAHSSAAALTRFDLTYVMWVLLTVVFVFASGGIDNYLSHRIVVRRRMQDFGEAFVREFDRPLVRAGSADDAIDSQLRFRPDQARLDVLLAPRNGRPYPNLADHRTNVEYDISRVLAAMNNPPVVHGPLRTQGRWIVVPFRFTLPIRQDGAK